MARLDGRCSSAARQSPHHREHGAELRGGARLRVVADPIEEAAARGR
jgi:hypothetical protein